MKSHLIKILENIKTSVESKDSNIAYQTNLDLLQVQPYERYLVIKGFKIAKEVMFYKWATLLQNSGKDDSKECMLVTLEEIYMWNIDTDIDRQFHADAYAGKNLEFFTDEIKLLLE